MNIVPRPARPVAPPPQADRATPPMPISPSVAPVDPLQSCTRILQMLDAGGDHFALLGLKPDASPAEVRDAYFRLAKLVHPDLPVFMHQPKLRLDATRAFQAITTAHATLADPTRRTQYVTQAQAQKVATGVAGGANGKQTGPDGAPMHEGALGLEVPPNLDVAKIYLHRGRQQLARRDWAGAQEALALAVTVLQEPQLGECKVALGWATLNNGQTGERERIDRPKALWSEVLEKSADQALQAQAAYYLAMWNKQHGDMKSVSKFLSECLRRDQRHVEALREKRLLDMRKGTIAPRSKPSGEVQKPSVAGAGSVPDKLAADVAAAAGKGRRSGTHVSAPAGLTRIPLAKKVGFFERLFGKR